MRLFLVGKVRPIAFEVLEYDPATHRAVLRGVDGTYVDTNFHPHMVKRAYELTEAEPDRRRGQSRGR